MTKVKYAAKAEFFDCGSRQESSLLLIHWHHKLISVDDVSRDAGSFVSSSLKQHQNPHWLSRKEQEPPRNTPNHRAWQLHRSLVR
jgi:hypothetical protein